MPVALPSFRCTGLTHLRRTSTQVRDTVYVRSAHESDHLPQLRLPRCPAARGGRHAGDRRRRRARPGSRGFRQCSRLAPNARPPVPCPSVGRLADAEAPATGRRPRRAGRSRRPQRDGVPARDEVFGARTGAFAEYVAVRERNFVPKPANLTLEQAAAIPVAAITALQGLRDKGQLRPGSGSWSTEPPAVSGTSPCRSPRRSAPRSRACPARGTSRWCGRSAPTT